MSKIVFDTEIEKHISNATKIANQTNQTQFVFMHRDGWIEILNEPPPPHKQLICEIYPDKTGEEIPDSMNWIRINQTAWLDISQYSHIKIHGNQLRTSNDEHWESFSCNREIIFAELKRIGFPMGDIDENSLS